MDREFMQTVSLNAMSNGISSIAGQKWQALPTNDVRARTELHGVCRKEYSL
jgi:hypothetical protein